MFPFVLRNGNVMVTSLKEKEIEFKPRIKLNHKIYILEFVAFLFTPRLFSNKYIILYSRIFCDCQVEIKGTTGLIQFNSSGTRINSKLDVKNLQNNKFVTVCNVKERNVTYCDVADERTTKYVSALHYTVTVSAWTYAYHWCLTLVVSPNLRWL